MRTWELIYRNRSANIEKENWTKKHSPNFGWILRSCGGRSKKPVFWKLEEIRLIPLYQKPKKKSPKGKMLSCLSRKYQPYQRPLMNFFPSHWLTGRKKGVVIQNLTDLGSKFDSKFSVENFFQNVENYSNWPKTPKRLIF